MKIALVHDHFLEFGGAERVAVALHDIYPDADFYTAAYNKSVTDRYIPGFDKWNVHTSWVSKIPFYQKLYSPLRFLAPLIWESFDFSKYDLVISSSGWFMSKGIKTLRPFDYAQDSGQAPTIHISYVHHPPGYLYGYQTAVEWQKYWPVKVYALIINHFLRMWDYSSSARADIILTNSHETAGRIKKFYRRDSIVVYPPVNIPVRVDRDRPLHEYYVTTSRLAFKKHVDVLIKAANKKKFTLKIIGTGRDEEYLKSIAGSTIEFVGYLPDDQFDKVLSGAKAFLNAAQEEEFGIAPVEAMGRGVPVIAYASGGLKETVHDGGNGYLFEELSEDSLITAINKLEKLSEKHYQEMRKNARKEAEKYSADIFKQNILAIVKNKVATY